jgi:glutamine amidotransferase
VIAVVDTGGANLASILHALARLGAKAEVTSDAAVVSRAQRVILPGVGSAPVAAQRLGKGGLGRAVKDTKVPVLGVCLGLQMLFDASEEGPGAGLGVLPGIVSRMRPAAGLPVPHMGWNQVRRVSGTTSPLLDGVDDGAHFYFVHSFQAPAGSWTAAVCDYGGSVPAVVRKDNFHGAQFHPERSGKAGARVLRNFLSL